jgi:predicted secreted protein
MRWSFRKPAVDPRSGRLVFLIECLLNQNARDRGAAGAPAVTQEVIKALVDADIGMAQIPCPEIACLGFERERPPGQSIREILEAPASVGCCNRLAVATAKRLQDYSEQGFEIVAILGGNEQSPGCAVHAEDADQTLLAPASGVFMQALARELRKRGLSIPFRGMRDADTGYLAKDLAWLLKRIAIRRP